MYWLICVTQRKNLKKLDKIIHNPSEKEHESLMETLQRGELLDGSKGNVYQVYYHFLLKKDEFLNINWWHVLNARFYIILMLCRKWKWRNRIPSQEDIYYEGCKLWWFHASP